nr:hypothetical protein [Tanacetum cinerariifolium]
MLPCPSIAVVAVRFCRKAFGLRGLSTSSSFKLPYRWIFAVATLNSLYVYGIEGVEPIAVLAILYYEAITDIAW